MYIDLYLEDEEVNRLEEGGFMKMLFPNGIEITVQMVIDNRE